MATYTDDQIRATIAQYEGMAGLDPFVRFGVAMAREVLALREALGAVVDAEAHGIPGGYIGVDTGGETHDRHCTYCYTFWRRGEPERHDDDCPVAVARALLDGEGGA